MARINIEDTWWTDPRRSALIRLMGSEELADGCALRLWRVAVGFWKLNRSPIPKNIYYLLLGAENMLSAGLVERIDENNFYACGSKQHLDWIIEKQKTASLAGKKSAQVRLSKYGTSQPKRRTPLEHRSNTGGTPPNKVERSSSSSPSSSYSEEKKYISLGSLVTERELLEVYAKYPRKAEDAVGLAKLRHEIRTPEDLKLFEKAVLAYEAKMTAEGREERFKLTFTKFMGIWRSCLAEGYGTVANKPRTLELSPYAAKKLAESKAQEEKKNV